MRNDPPKATSAVPPLPPGQLVRIESDGRLRSTQNDNVAIVTEELFAVVVLWDVDDASPWLGYLATTTHRSVCFSSADIADHSLLGWLSALPGWEPSKLSHATTNPGFHLVWRRRPTIEIPRQ
jgi:hypothetical protein